MSTFRGSDILEFAIRIEENGENFYRYAIQLTNDEETKKLFARLADEEKNHQKIFRKIFAAMEKVNPPETYDGEYDAYLHNFIDGNIVFKKVDEVPKNVADAVEFALRRELDSILFYHEIKRLVPQHEHHIVDAIIEEERQHYNSLLKLVVSR
ncbi:MAG: ferritin family protein [Syntrophales bacterium]|nr:ferritin family protein [Syntrophales bacterium]